MGGWGEGGHPDPEIRESPVSKFFFSPMGLSLKCVGGGGGGGGGGEKGAGPRPPLDPLLTLDDMRGSPV